MRIARHFGGEIVSVDSMQVYRGMDIGTAKPSPADRRAVRHHCVDIADPSHDFSVAEFQAAGRDALGDIEQRGVTAVISGGTGLHFRSLVDPLDFPPTDDELRADLERADPETLRRRLLAIDPRAGDHVDLPNPRRVLRAVEVHAITGQTPTERASSARARMVQDYVAEVPFVGVGLDPGDALRDRIERRFDAMLDAGLVEEVRRLEPVMGRVARQAVGYKEMIDVVSGEIDLAAGRTAAVSATTALAKRQRTYFRRDPRIQWLPPDVDGAMAFTLACAIIERSAEG
jgi:tRNA dimethylallyltransferase